MEIFIFCFEIWPTSFLWHSSKIVRKKFMIFPFFIPPPYEKKDLENFQYTMKLKKTLTLGNFHIWFWNLVYPICMAFFKDCMKKIHGFSIFYTPSIWKKDLENFQWFFTMKFQTTLTMGNFVLLFSNLAYLIFRTCLKDCAKKIHDFSIFYTPSIWKKKT